MHLIPWSVPMKAQAPRANDLQGLQFERQGLSLRLTEDETEQTWLVTFTSVQAFRVTTEACAWHFLAKLPHPGGFFEILDSPWLQELIKGAARLGPEAMYHLMRAMLALAQDAVQRYDGTLLQVSG